MIETKHEQKPFEAKFRFNPVQLSERANAVLEKEDVWRMLFRHCQGDWGDVCEEDKRANDEALKSGARLLSSYHDRNGVKFWVITEADRSSTTVLLPGEY